MLTASFFSLPQPAIEYAQAWTAHNGLVALVVEQRDCHRQSFRNVLNADA
jgi:hypothetical protein